MIKKLLIVAAGFFLSFGAMAQVVTVKGVGTISYSNAAELTPQDKDRAYQAAQVAAVERYFAENGEAEAANFESDQEKVQANLEKFILSSTVLNEQDQPGVKKYSVALKVELNVAKLRNTLKGSSAVSKSSSAEKSQLVYLFMGREVSSVRSFDERVVKRVEVTGKDNSKVSSTKSGSEGESIKADSVSTTATKRNSKTATIDQSMKVETGGSVTRKADDVAYRLLPMTNTKTSITSVFSQAGFNVADPEFVLGDKDIKAVNSDFTTGSDLAPTTIRDVVLSMRKAQVPLLVLATLDLGAPAVDGSSGMPRVAVNVTARVLDISGNLPREVASVPAVQYFGVGPDNASAAGKALKDASVAAAREIVARLNERQVH